MIALHYGTAQSSIAVRSVCPRAMEGVLWFEAQLHNDFIPQYCILNPFRGMRCINVAERTAQSVAEEDGVWIFGGDACVKRIDAEETPIMLGEGDDGTDFYPFSIWLGERAFIDDGGQNVRRDSTLNGHVQQQQQPIRLRLAVTQAELRTQWCEALEDACLLQDYLYACVECGAAPSLQQFRALTFDQFRAIRLFKGVVSPTELGAIVILCTMHREKCLKTTTLEIGLGAISDIHVPLLQEMLRTMPNLTCVGVFQNQLSDDNVAAIVGSLSTQHLTSLDLSSNAISDAGAEHVAAQVASMPALHSLNLSNNFIGPAGCAALTRALTAYECTVEEVYLSHNPIGDAAGELCAKMLLVREQERLHYISIAYCMVSDNGFQQIALALDNTIASSLKVSDAIAVASTRQGPSREREP